MKAVCAQQLRFLRSPERKHEEESLGNFQDSIANGGAMRRDCRFLDAKLSSRNSRERRKFSLLIEPQLFIFLLMFFLTIG
jgi:hypothetical protein